MSKKHKRQGQFQSAIAPTGSFHQGEYSIIKHDLIKVIVLNFIYLAGILVIYFTNQKTHYLENWFSKVLHF